MKLLFVGPQGCGKGTQAKVVAGKLGLCHISMGDLLRDASPELKDEISSYQNKGELVPVEIVIKILKQRIEKSDCGDGFILDGFPRNEAQAEHLDEIMKIDKVILIDISDKETIRRLSGRRNCPDCGMIYNVNTAPKPKEDEKCDKCGVDLFARDDDKPEAIQKRLDVYHAETEPILEKYSDNLVKIDGEQDIEKVSEDIFSALKDLE